MSVKIRLRRMGNTNRPFYRLVAIDGRRRRDGRAIQELGWYDPLKKPEQVRLEEEPILEWLDRGAQPSETVRELLRDHGVLLKWQLRRAGVGAEEATARVAEHLAARPEKTEKQRPSKKARAKAAAAPEPEAAAATQTAPEGADAGDA